MNIITLRRVGFVSVLIGVVVLSGCGGEKVQQLKDTKDRATSAIETGKDVIDAGKKISHDGNTLTGGLKNMLKGGASLKCVSVDDESEWVTYTNGKNVKSQGVVEGRTQNVLVVDGTFYRWDDTTKKGLKMDKSCIQELQERFGVREEDMNMGQNQGFDFSFDRLEEEESSGKVTCSPSTAADFSVPADVQFVDQCEMLQKQMAGFQQLPRK